MLCPERGSEEQLDLEEDGQLCLGLAGLKDSGGMCASYVPTHHFFTFPSASLSSEWRGRLQFSVNKSEKHPCQVQKGYSAPNHTEEPEYRKSQRVILEVVAESGLWPNPLIQWYFQSYRGCKHLPKSWINSGALYSHDLFFL